MPTGTKKTICGLLSTFSSTHTERHGINHIKKKMQREDAIIIGLVHTKQIDSLVEECKAYDYLIIKVEVLPEPHNEWVNVVLTKSLREM